MRPMFPKVRPPTFDVRPVEELEAIGIGNRTQPCNRVRGTAVENQVTATTLFHIVPDELSSDLGKRRIGFRHAGQCARCAAHRRGSMSRPNSICRTVARLPRFSALILRMGCNIPVFPQPLRSSAPATLPVPAREGSPICSPVRPGRTSWCCSPASSWRPAGAPSRRRCASWDETAIPTSALSTASSTGQRGRPAPVAGRLLILLVNTFVAVRRTGRDRAR